MRKFRYDYYTIAVPGDAADDLHQLAQLAMAEAYVNTRTYAMPAEWRATHVSGAIGDWRVVFRVTRKRAR